MLRLLDFLLWIGASLLTFHWIGNNTHAGIIVVGFGAAAVISYVRGMMDD
jgi:hypothetical protein